MATHAENLNATSRVFEVRERILQKPFLKKFYEEVYEKFQNCIDRAPVDGLAIELGSGASFAKEKIPRLLTTDVVPYNGLDRIVDATNMPFEDESVSCICLFDVFHHIPDVEKFFQEANRCLKPGGRMLIVDQYLGWISRPILRFAHHEPYHPESQKWAFESDGPLTGANGALAWMVFERDREIFEKRFPRLKIVQYEPHTPLRYWLSGGLKAWTLTPGWSFPLVTRMDQILAALPVRLSSFVDIELVKNH